jgi:NAD(P)-dependent dehydrogenase (short-subunit alcohol dehydrogenase family)
VGSSLRCMKIGSGTVAVVTGAASGIGQGCALEFARRGADVVIADINDERMAETAKLVEGVGRQALTVHCDVREDADLAALRDRSLERFGRVDVLMNNAGVVLMGPPETIPIDDWRWIFEVNVFGLIRGVQAFVPYFQEQGRGHVVNTASIAGRYAYTFDAIPYITSKFAAYGFSEGLYLYLKSQGIGLSVLCPGLVATNLGEGMRFSGSADREGWVYLPEDMSTATVEDIGVLVADAVENDRYMIYTDPADEQKLLERYRDITAALEAQLAVMPKPPKVVA